MRIKQKPVKVLIFALMIALLTACAPTISQPTSTETSTATATIISAPNPTATATEAPTATPEVQVAPSNAEFMNYSISTDTIVNHTDDLVAKARSLDWGPDSTNPKYVNMNWYPDQDGSLEFNSNTAPNYNDASTRFFKRRVIGFNTDSGFVSVVSATRFQLPGLDPKDYPIIIGAADQYFSDGAPITEGSIKDAVNMYLDDMNYTLYEVPKNGPVQDGLARKYFQAYPEKLKIARDVFGQLQTFSNAPGKSNFVAIKDLNGMVLPFMIGKVASGNQEYK